MQIFWVQLVLLVRVWVIMILLMLGLMVKSGLRFHHTVKIILKGKPIKTATPKDVVLRLLQEFGANGLLGYSAEIYGDYVDRFIS